MLVPSCPLLRGFIVCIMAIKGLNFKAHVIAKRIPHICTCGTNHAILVSMPLLGGGEFENLRGKGGSLVARKAGEMTRNIQCSCVVGEHAPNQ